MVLGPTGRNFAAGMSGGVAFVYDSDGSFPARINREMVLVEAIDADDRVWLRDLLVRHQAETGSEVAEQLLSSWEIESTQFVKVMPTDYKRVLEAAAAARAAGRDEVAAIMASTGN